MAKTYFYSENTQAAKMVKDLDKVENGIDVVYTDGSKKQIEIASSGGSSGSGKVRGQVTKLDVAAPKDVRLEIDPVDSFAFPPVEVLKFKDGVTNVARTVCEFENGDASDFEPNPMVEFNGTMRLKTKQSLSSSETANYLKSITIDKTEMEQMVKVETTNGGIFTCYTENGKRVGKHAITLTAGSYSIECWGGGSNGADKLSYCKGEVNLIEATNLFLHVAGAGKELMPPGIMDGGYNGGGQGGCGANWQAKPHIWSGGGASDIRLIDGEWNDQSSLKSRIMVAGGVGGNGTGSYSGTNAGGLTGENNVYSSTGGTQTSGGSGGNAQGLTNGSGSFGKGGDVITHKIGSYGGGGGAGYYGGGSGAPVSGSASGGSGGSSFISGHTGCNAINAEGSHTNQPIHYSGIFFLNTIMKGSAENNEVPDIEGRLLGEGIIVIRKLNEIKWIVENENSYFTIEDGTLVSLTKDKAELNATLFDSRGFAEINDITLCQDYLANTFNLWSWAEQTIGIQVQFIPKPQLIIPAGDLKISEFKGLKKVSLEVNGSAGLANVIISFDKGGTWKTYKDELWTEINLDTENIIASGIAYTKLSEIPEAKWQEVRSETIRFAYCLKLSEVTDDLAIDAVILTADMAGSWCKSIHPTDYTYEYTAKDVLIVNLLTNGSYKINYGA